MIVNCTSCLAILIAMYRQCVQLQTANTPTNKHGHAATTDGRQPEEP
jgi:hypothetical protein